MPTPEGGDVLGRGKCPGNKQKPQYVAISTRIQLCHIKFPSSGISNKTMAEMYSALDKAKQEIRLLKLNKGVEADQISGTLEIVPIASSPSYEALSYAWGDSQTVETVSLNGMPFLVTENLFIALQHLRLSDSERLLWIDALCIDQSNYQERLQQVQMMGEIYKNAQVVLAWLGPSTYGSDLVMDVIKQLAYRAHAADSIPSDSFEEPPPGGVVDLLNRPYWSRAWVVQELAIPESDPLVGCGHKWLSWTMMRPALLQCHAHFGSLSDAHNEKIRSAFQILYGACKESIGRFIDMDQIRRSLQPKLRQQCDIRQSSTTFKTNILDLLWRTRDRRSTDPRDRIYSLLGVFRLQNSQNITDIGLEPDYTKSLHFVFATATKMIIRLERNLDVLHLKNHVSFDSLPSWTPNFSIPLKNCFPPLAATPLDLNRPSLTCRYIRGSALGQYYEQKCSTSEELDELRVRGQKFDSISVVINMDDFYDDPYICVRRVHNAVMARNQENPLRSVSKNMEIHSNCLEHASKNVSEIIWRTLCANYSDDIGSPCPSDRGGLYAQITHSESKISRPENYTIYSGIYSNDLLRDIARAISNGYNDCCRQFFISQMGFLGLGPHECTERDIITLFEDFSNPVVLRCRGTHYKYIGTAYVHGIMAGEELEIDLPDSEDFVLR